MTMSRFVFVSFAVWILLVAGCGGDDPVGPDGDPDMGGTLLSAEQNALLDHADELFDRLATAGTPSEARAALVDSLSVWDGVGDVRLWEDGATVGFRFADGSLGAVPTGGSAGFGGGAALEPSVPSFTAAVPDSSSVLFLVLATDVPDVDAHVADARGIFLDNGWDADDVSVRRPSAPSDQDVVNPGTLLHEIQSHGLIFIYTHGIYGRPVLTMTSQLYVQFCYNYEYTNFDLDVLRSWKDEGKIICSRGSLYIRSDVLSAEMDHLPGSFVMFNCCWGYYGRDAFLENGAESVFSWDHMVMGDDSYAATSRIAREMGAERTPALSDLDLFGDPLLVKTSLNVFGETAELHLDHHGFDELFFPAEAAITCDLSSISFDVSGVRIVANGENSGRRTALFGADGAGVMTGLTPGAVDFTIEVLDLVGGVAMQSDYERQLHGGVNELTFDLSVQIAPGNLVMFTYEDGMGGYGPYTTVFMRYWLWNQNPDGEGFSVIWHDESDPDDIVVTGPHEMYMAEDEDQYDNCLYTSEGIAEIYGEDFLGVGDGQVVRFRETWVYFHHHGEDTISDWIAEGWEELSPIIAHQWYEVSFR